MTDDIRLMQIQCVWCGGRITLPRYDSELMRKELEGARKRGYDAGYAQAMKDAAARQEGGRK